MWFATSSAGVRGRFSTVATKTEVAVARGAQRRQKRRDQACIASIETIRVEAHVARRHAARRTGVSGLEVLREAPSRSLIGVDLSPEMLRRAQRHAAERAVDLPLVRADALHLPFRDGAYDGATGHSFLYLLPDGDAVLREVHRVVRPGGSIVFLEPNALGLRERARSVVQAYAGGVRFGTSMLLWGIFSAMHGRYTPDSLTRQLARCGFRTTDVALAFGGLGLVATATRS